MTATNERNEITHEGHTALNERKARIKNLQAVEKNTSNGNFEGLRSFAQDTTLHGAKFLFCEGFIRRLVWLGMIVVCFGFCTYQVYFVCLKEY